MKKNISYLSKADLKKAVSAQTMTNRDRERGKERKWGKKNKKLYTLNQLLHLRQQKTANTLLIFFQVCENGQKTNK